ncbi:hypothetical protein [Aliikangiella sp. IMCC44359]
MSENKPQRILSEHEKQIQPLPGEVDPRNAKMKTFFAVHKAKQKLPKGKR